MERQDEDLIQTLLPANEALRLAYEEHVRLKTEVDELKARPHLSPGEELDKKTLQKRKLVEKDKIMVILAEHRRDQARA
jgi:uncharacterized protein YdcH (DUF465 family)